MADNTIRLVGFRPTGRDDGVFWTEIEVWEAESSTADGLQIDLQPFPAYADPLNPPTVSVTTDDVTLESGWYWLVFLDTPGPGRQETARVAAPGANQLPPNAAAVRDRSGFLQAVFPPEPPDADVEQGLRETVQDATAIVESLTGRTLDQDLPERDGARGHLPTLALRAVTLKAEQLAFTWSGSARRGALGRANLRSISAGPWSESYFGPADAAKARVLDPDPRMHEVLWALATDEIRDYWIGVWSGVHPPASVITEVDWFPEARGGY